MPTYDYQCDACGHKFELFQPIKASPLKKCPSCKKIKIRRLIGIGAGVIFKGSGFYCTDYRDKTYATAAQKDKSQATSSTDAATTASKSEPKPAAEKGEKTS